MSQPVWCDEFNIPDIELMFKTALTSGRLGYTFIVSFRKYAARLKKINYYYLYLGLLVLIAIGSIFFFAQKGKQTGSPALNLEYCTAEKAEDFKCWREYYKQIVNQASPKTALLDAQKQYDSNRFIKDNCHEIAHVIGRAAGIKYPTVSEAYSLGTDFCASGYYHGVMQTVVDEIGKEKIIASIDTICQPLAEKKQYSLSHYNCVHGLGHGVMSVEGNELFLALRDCDGLSGTWQQDSCYSGVFMENIIGEIDPDHYTAYLKEDDPLYPCTAVDDKYKKMCYFLQTDHALIVERADFDKVFDHCSSLGNLTYSTMCYQSLGRNASSYAKYDIDVTRGYCLLGDSETAQRNCFTAAATDFAWHFQSDKQALKLCSVINQSRIAELCEEAVRNFVYKES